MATYISDICPDLVYVLMTDVNISYICPVDNISDLLVLGSNSLRITRTCHRGPRGDDVIGLHTINLLLLNGSLYSTLGYFRSVQTTSHRNFLGLPSKSHRDNGTLILLPVTSLRRRLLEEQYQITPKRLLEKTKREVRSAANESFRAGTIEERGSAQVANCQGARLY
ncbi:hypothetical protein J6590_017335 [Homalodisca vitripennis]|nr:hypothetical protein J6590_017335 [Homalodisca vitripennis]